MNRSCWIRWMVGWSVPGSSIIRCLSESCVLFGTWLLDRDSFLVEESTQFICSFFWMLLWDRSMHFRPFRHWKAWSSFFCIGPVILYRHIWMRIRQFKYPLSSHLSKYHDANGRRRRTNKWRQPDVHGYVPHILIHPHSKSCFWDSEDKF